MPTTYENGGYEVTLNFGDVAKDIAGIWDTFKQDQDAMLDSVGTATLAFAKEDFQDKGEGRTGGDGIQWEPLSRAAIASRLRRSSAKYRNLFLIPTPDRDTAKVRKQRQKRNAKRRAKKSKMIDEAMSNHQILVDTGRLRDGLTAGHRQNNIFQIEDMAVVVGTVRKVGSITSGMNLDVAPLHNEGGKNNKPPKRQIIGKETLEAEYRQDDLTDIVEQYIDLALQKKGFKP